MNFLILPRPDGGVWLSPWLSYLVGFKIRRLEILSSKFLNLKETLFSPAPSQCKGITIMSSVINLPQQKKQQNVDELMKELSPNTQTHSIIDHTRLPHWRKKVFDWIFSRNPPNIQRNERIEISSCSRNTNGVSLIFKSHMEISLPVPECTWKWFWIKKNWKFSLWICDYAVKWIIKYHKKYIKFYSPGLNTAELRGREGMAHPWADSAQLQLPMIAETTNFEFHGLKWELLHAFCH